MRFARTLLAYWLIYFLVILQLPVYAQTTFDASTQLTERIPNDTSTGTVVNQLAKLSAGKVVSIGTSDTAIPVYIVVGNAGTSGNASLASSGTAQCKFDAAGGTSGHFVQASTTIGSMCHDAGTTIPSTGWTIGQLLTSPAANSLGTLILNKGVGQSTTTMHTDSSQTMTPGTFVAMDTARAKYWGDAPVFDVAEQLGVDWCAKNLAVLTDPLYILAVKAILDSRGLTGPQFCAAGSTTLTTSKPTHWILGQMDLSLPNSGVSFLDINGVPTSLAAPTAPTLSTSTSGGSLAAATTFGIKIGYQNLTGPTAPSTESTKLTGAGATNSIGVPSPSGLGSATCYDIYSATPPGSGWKLNNLTGCIPIGTAYTIKTVGTGAVPPVTGTAWEGMFEFEGQGDSTVIHEDSVNSPFLISANNVRIHHLKFVSSQTTNNNGSLWIDSSKDIEADHLTFAGGGHGIFINASSRVRTSTIHCGKFTISGSCIAATNSSNVFAKDLLENDTVIPAGGNLQGVANFINCTNCNVDGWTALNIDFSLIANAAAIIYQQGSSGTATNGFADSLCNSDGTAALVMSGPVHFSNTTIQNTKVGTTVCAGNNANNGDAFDIDDVSNVTIDNYHAINLGLIGGLRFPCGELYNSNNIIVTGFTCTGSTGEGINEFGCTGCKVNSSTLTNNGKSGLLVQDSVSTVSCNGTPTITFTGGFGAGPWPIGTQFTVAGANHTLAAVPTSTTSITAVANCTTGSGLAFVLSTQDTQANSSQFDDNGTGAVGATSCSGIDILGNSSLAVNGGSANDNRPTATKKQCFGINASGAGASFSMTNFDPSGNLGAACTNEIGAAVAGNHQLCDVAGKSTYFYHDAGSEIWHTSNIKMVKADVTNATTTFATVTGLTFNASPSIKYNIGCDLIWQTNTLATGGLKLQVIGPASPTSTLFKSAIMSHTSANSGNAIGLNISTAAVTTAMNGGAATVAAATNYEARLTGTFENGTTTGLVSIQFAEQGAGTATIKRGSSCQFNAIQ